MNENLRPWLRRLGFLSLGLLLGLWLMLSRQPQSSQPAAAPAVAKEFQIAIFAGGCFWCMEPPFDKLPGVMSTTSGYIGGFVKNPSYEMVSSGSTGHAEAVQIVYDPRKITYQKLLEVFWHQIDPTTLNRQFVDIGSQYRTAIFYTDAKQKQLASKSLLDMEKSHIFKATIVTAIVPADGFWPAEEYHQNYYLKHPYKYHFYRWKSGRDNYLEQIWGKK